MKFIPQILLLFLILPQSLAESEESEWFNHERWSGLQTDDHASVVINSGRDKTETYTALQIGCDNEELDDLYLAMTWAPPGFAPFAKEDDEIMVRYRLGNEQTIHEMKWIVQSTFAQNVDLVLEERKEIIGFVARLLSEEELSIWPVDNEGNKLRAKIYENPTNETDNPLITSSIDITGIEEAVKPVLDQCDIEMDTLNTVRVSQDQKAEVGTIEHGTTDKESASEPQTLENKYLPVSKSPDFAFRFGLQIGMLIGVTAISGSETASLMCEDTSIPILKDIVQEYFDDAPEEDQEQGPTRTLLPHQ